MMAVNGMGRIPTPWRLRWHRFRYSTLPLLGLIGFVAATFLLWTRQGEMPHAIGEVEAIRIDVASSLSGILMPLPGLPEGRWTLYEIVEKGDVLAQLDDRPLRAEMETLVRELSRLKKELDAASAKLVVSEATRGLDYMAEKVRLRVELEQRSLVVVERQVDVAVNRLEAQRKSTYFDCLKPLYEKKIVSELELTNARLLRDEAVKRLAENTKVLGEAETEKKGAETRLALMPKFQSADVTKVLAPIAEAVRVQEAKINGVDVEISRLTVHAPFKGMICAIHAWPHSAIRAGDPIVTLASDKGRYLVSYVRQEQHVEPKEDMAVDVRKRLAISPTVRTIVERVGPQVEPIPVHLCRDPKMPEWGRPVRITLPDGFPGRPGELFEVTFKTRP
jgi:multidrug resistance efflux pump